MGGHKYAALAAVAILVLCFGCTGLLGGEPARSEAGGGTIGTGGYPSAAPSWDGEGIIPQQYQDPSGRMVIKTGSAQVLVPEGTLEQRYSQLKGIVNASGGYVYGTQYGETATQRYYSVTVKVPPSEFESLQMSLSAVGDVKSLSTDTSDVTEQYMDLAVRIRNLEVEKARLMEFYNRTENVSELLQVEREVTRVQTEIEQLTSQKKYLERRAEFATMTIRIYEETPLVDRTVMVPLSSLVSVFLQALSFAIMLIAALMGFGIPFLAGIAVLFGLFLLVRRITRRKK